MHPIPPPETERSEPSDEALLSRYARGDVPAFEILYHRHEMRIWRYLRRNLADRATAEELLQEVWFAVARDAARYQPSARFTTWLFTIAHNRMIDSIRASRRQPDLQILGEAADRSDGPLAAAIAGDQASALMRAIEALPSEQRECFLLQAEGSLQVEEIAVITQSSFETVKSRLRYARTKLRESLKEHA
jgi:RNA polymerase sigma factor (sigma-70 family)